MLELPSVIFGTSGLGNLYTSLPGETKLAIVREAVASSPVVFDTAGKYGAGLALEALGQCLRSLNVPPESVIISNKLGWYRVPLTTPEPAFEPGVWKNLQHDAVQRISYAGIMQCFEQGNKLLGGYIPQLVSVHDPDEYLNSGHSYDDILEGYEALHDLRSQGQVKSIGVGAKDWRVIQRIAGDVDLDWVMIANSMTIHRHPEELLVFMEALSNKGIYIINSAVFHAGFLTGGAYYDYQLLNPANDAHKAIFRWREQFFEICQAWQVQPAEACVQFALSAPGVGSIALNTTAPSRVKQNVAMAQAVIPPPFWDTLRMKGLISANLVK